MLNVFFQGGNSTLLGEIIKKNKKKNKRKIEKFEKKSECILRAGVLRDFVLFCVFVLYGPFYHGAP